MSIPNEALRKVLLEIEQKSIFSSQQMAVVKSQLTNKNRESRILQLTTSEVAGLPQETPVYEGVGKMFIQAPKKEVVERLEKQQGEIKEEVVNLEKKLHYLETTYKNSREHLDQILKRSSGS